MSATIAYFLRHAEVDRVAALPVAAWALSLRGREQAKSVCCALSPIRVAAIYSSPAVRCIETVQPLAESRGVPVLSDVRLRERDLGVDRVSDDYSAMRSRSWEDFAFAPPGGESFRECQQRVTAVMAELLANHRGDSIVVSGHGNTIGLFLQAICPPFGLRDALRIASPDLIEVRHHRDRMDGSWEYARHSGLPAASVE